MEKIEKYNYCKKCKVAFINYAEQKGCPFCKYIKRNLKQYPKSNIRKVTND